MAEQYEGLDESTLSEMLSNASSYEERSAIRKALRKAKGDSGRAKKTGAATYRRAGYQAATKVTIPNSVTGNVLPNKVNMEHPNKLETPQTTATISYLKKDSEKTGSVGRRSTTPNRSRLSSRTSTGNTPEPRTPDLPKEEVEDAKPRSSQAVNITVEETPSPQPPAIQTRVNGEREASPEPAREASPEPARESTPEPVREPSPPPREPTPEPPREPTPEPEPEPPREPTPEPEPPREPTPEPEPPREPTPEPEPPREPTPEPEPEEEEEEERVKSEVAESEEEEEEEEEEYDEEDEEEEDERETRREQRRRGGSEERHGQEYRPGRAAGGEKKVGTVIPTDVLVRKEEGVDGGDFRKKLQKTAATKIDTRAAFPQAKTKGEQVDFRNVLKKTSGPERKVFKSGVQQDFRSELKKLPKDDAAPPPVRAKKPRERRDEVEERQESEEPPKEEENQQPEEEEKEAEEEEEKEVEEEVEQEEEQQEESGGVDEVDAKPSQVSSRSKADEEDDDYEVRVAERKRRREERRKELEELGGSSPSTAPAKEEEVEEEEKKPVENGTGESSSPRDKQSSSPAAEVDSYEARREARRKAREERLKAAAARVEEKQPKMSYRDRKAREQMANAKENRKKWENREEESGEKAEAKSNVKKSNTATQQLLAWCQHKTKYYENVEVKDFRTSWSDGLAFCAIMHSFLPDKIPYDDLSADNPRKNFTIAFDAAEDAGIPRMLDVDDMITVKIPDAKSIMTFLVTIYQHFNS